MTKICKCGESDLNNFYVGTQRGKNGQTWKYLDSMCKTCRLNYGNERRRVIKRQAIDYLGGKCVDCGLEDSCADVYDFHHKDPQYKDFAIGDNTKKFDSIKIELDKCILLCANCHRRRHSCL